MHAVRRWPIGCAALVVVGAVGSSPGDGFLRGPSGTHAGRVGVGRAATAPTATAQEAPGVADLPLDLPEDRVLAMRLLSAEDRRDPTGLEELTRSPDPRLRGRAALALGRVGLPGAVPRLLELLGDARPEVRALAAFALGVVEYDVGPPAAVASRQQAATAVAARLGDDGPLVAAQAAWTLGVLGEAAGRESLLQVLGAPATPAAVLTRALGAWWRMPAPEPTPILPHLGAAEAEVRLAAVNALRRIDDPGAHPRLVPMLDDADPLVRAAAARGLQGAPATVAAAHAVRLLGDADWRVRVEALAWLAAAWRQAERVDEATVGAVLRASLERDLHVQAAALAALAGLADRWPVARDRVARAIDNAERAVRAATLDGLAVAGIGAARELLGTVRRRYGLDEPPAPASPLPEALRESPHEAAAVARYLGIVADSETDAWLERMLAEGPTAARSAVLRAWQERDPQRAAAAARVVLERGEPVLVAVAAEVLEVLDGLGSLPSSPADGWGPALWNAQARTASVGALEPRLLALSALEVVAPALLAQRRTLLLADEDRVVRLWALRHLGLDDAATIGTVAGPSTAESGDERYERMVARLAEWRRSPPELSIATPRGELVVGLRPDWAPLSVVALVDLVEGGFFEGVTFHRVVPDFVVQAGDPTATGYGGAPGAIRSEEAPVTYETGTVGLALAGRDTGNGQFFITHSPQPHLDGLYPVLGRLVAGQRVLGRIQVGDPLEASVVGAAAAESASR